MNESPALENWTSAPIAICLSGGGYRAAAFHLGTLAYLNRVNLLKNVTSISTVSGGTFTGAMYILSLIEKLSFDRFYSRFCKLLLNTHLVKRGLSHMGAPAKNVSKRRNIIVSMAEVYADTFYKKKDNTPYLLRDILKAEVPLPNISFNATEFRTGIAFRFQNRKGAIIGNGNVSVPLDQAGDIRVADIVAASSCFPGGFEPLAFPDDFVWPTGEVPSEITKRLSQNGMSKTVALMDGGVYDNQGASALDRSVYKEAEKLSMFITSDVSSDPEDLYPFPQDIGLSGFFGRRTLGQVNLALWGLYLICGLSAVALGIQVFRQLKTRTFSVVGDSLLYLIPLILTGITFITLRSLRNIVVGQILPKIPQAKLAAWSNLKHVTINQLVEMITLRVTSLYKMSSSIFMKRIRSLVYNSIYRDERYQKKRVANLIYDLKSAKPPSQHVSGPSEKLRKLAASSAAIPTTLWFDDSEQLSELIACGQSTICYNLIKILGEKFGDDPDVYASDVKELHDQITKDWRMLCNNPREYL